VSETPETPADPVAAEDERYAAVVSEIRGLRRAGATLLEACAQTAFYRVALGLAQQEPAQP
jgi:hypothetical protein